MKRAKKRMREVLIEQGVNTELHIAIVCIHTHSASFNNGMNERKSQEKIASSWRGQRLGLAN